MATPVLRCRACAGYLADQAISITMTGQQIFAQPLCMTVHNAGCKPATEGVQHVTHDPDDALYLADRIGVMLGGHIRQVATPQELFRCMVEEWENSGPLLAVHISSSALTITALVTYESFREPGIDVGTELYCTFKSSAVHCF